MKSFLFLSSILLLFACNKQQKVNVLMTYHMTQCADLWMTDDYFTDKEGVLKAFLEGKGVEIVDISIETDCGQAIVCKACTCLGCDIATVKVPLSDENLMKSLNFVPK